VQLPAFTDNHIAFIARLTQAIGPAAVNQLLVAPGKNVAGIRITREHLRKLFRKVIKKAVQLNTNPSDDGLDGHWSNIGRRVLGIPPGPIEQFNSSVGGKVKNLYATVSITVLLALAVCCELMLFRRLSCAQHLSYLEVYVPPPFQQALLGGPGGGPGGGGGGDAGGPGGAGDSTTTDSGGRGARGGCGAGAVAPSRRPLTIMFPEEATAEHAAAPLAFTAGVLTELTSNARTAAAELQHLRTENEVENEGAVPQAVGDGDFGLISTLHANLRIISESVDASRVGRLHTIAVLARFVCLLPVCIRVSLSCSPSLSLTPPVFVYAVCVPVCQCTRVVHVCMPERD
jgi:hypothetical protein